MKTIYTLLCCFITAYSCIAQTVVRFKPGPERGEDARISTSFGCTPSGAPAPHEVQNFGDHTEMIYISWTISAAGCSRATDRVLLRFAGMDTLLPGTCRSVRKAELNLFAVKSSGSWGTSYFPGTPYPKSNEGWVERVTGSWDEHIVTWNTQPSVTSVNRIAIPFTNARWGWATSLDVTTLVQDILASGTNNGFRISLQTEEYYRAVFLASSDHSDSTLWPELVLYFDTGVVAIKDTAVCTGTTISLNASGALSYKWSPATGLSDPAIPNPTLTVTGTQTYIVEGTCKDGSKSYDTVVITANPLPKPFAGPDTSVCNHIVLKLRASGADSFNWSPSTDLSDPTVAEPLLTVKAGGTYIVKGINKTGCIAYDTLIIGLLPDPVITAGPDTTLCEGSSVLLHATGADTYTWSPATGISDPHIAGPVFTAGMGPTGLIVTGKDKNGCIGYDTVRINVLAAPVLNAGPDTAVCINTRISLYASGADSFLWSPPTGLSNPQSPDPQLTVLGTTRLYVRGKSSAGCIGYDTVDIEVREAHITAGPDTVLCPGTSIRLYATGADAYSWSPATGLDRTDIADPMLHLAGPVSYIVHGTDRYGCEAYDTVFINTLPVPDIQAIADKYSGCRGDTLQLNAHGGIRYSWSPESGLDRPGAADPVLQLGGSGPYIVTGWDSKNCSATDTIWIEQYPVAHVEIYTANNTVSCKEPQTLLEASGALQYSWTPAAYCSSPDSAFTMVSPPRTMIYTLNGANEYGCRGWDTITVFYDNNSVVRIPNSFTPNGDGLNDRIKPYIVCDFRLKEFAVYSRWGQQVFLTADINTSWDGTFNGQPQELGTYFYLIKGYDANDTPVLLKGDINLLR